MLLAGIGIGVAPLLPAAGAESGASNIEVGTWWALQQDGTTLPPPATVVPGGAWVSRQASGDLSLTAIRFPLEDNESQPVLTLKIHTAQPSTARPETGSSPAPAASGVAIVACITASPWKPVTAGAWSARPTPNCSSGSILGVPSPDGTTMAFDLSTIAPRGDVDIMLIPGIAGSVLPAVPQVVPGVPQTPDSTAFDATFEKAGADAVAVVVGPTPVPSTTAPETIPEPVTAVPFQPVVDLPSSGGSFSPPGLSAEPAPAVTQPAAIPAVVVRQKAQLQRQARSRLAVATPSDNLGSGRLVAGLAFVLLAGLWYRSSFGRVAAATAIRPKRLSLYDAPPSGPRTDPAAAPPGLTPSKRRATRI